MARALAPRIPSSRRATKAASTILSLVSSPGRRGRDRGPERAIGPNLLLVATPAVGAGVAPGATQHPADAHPARGDEVEELLGEGSEGPTGQPVGPQPVPLGG